MIISTTILMSITYESISVVKAKHSDVTDTIVSERL